MSQEGEGATLPLEGGHHRRRPRRTGPRHPGWSSPATATSSSLRRRRASAARGAGTPIPVPPATCRRTSTPIRSPSRPIGRRRTPTSPRSSVLRGVRRPLRHPAAPAPAHPDQVGHVGRGSLPMVSHRHERRDLLVRRAGERDRDVHYAFVPRHHGPQRLRRADVPLGALGAPARPRRQTGRRHRDRRRARRRSSPRWPRSRSRCTSTSGRRSGSCPARTRRSAKRTSNASPVASGRPRSTATRSTGPSRRPLLFATRMAPPTG